jgi:hypothetical protein
MQMRWKVSDEQSSERISCDGAILVGFMWIAGGRATDAHLVHLMVRSISILICQF